MSRLRDALRKNIATPLALAGALVGATAAKGTDYGLIFADDFEKGTYSSWSAVANSEVSDVAHLAVGCRVVGTDFRFPPTVDLRSVDAGRIVRCTDQLEVRMYNRPDGAFEAYDGNPVYDPDPATVELEISGGEFTINRHDPRHVLTPPGYFPASGTWQQHN